MMRDQLSVEVRCEPRMIVNTTEPRIAQEAQTQPCKAGSRSACVIVA